MLKSNRAVISVPGNELRNANVPGSLFDAEQLQQMPISEELLRAYKIVSTLCNDPLCVVRPEIFAHGKARTWIDTKLRGVRDHICLSDGTAVKLMAGLENHVFFYQPGQRRGSAGLKNLLTWVPETFSHIRSQINTFQGVVLNGRLVQPPTVLSLPKARSTGAPAELYKYLLNPQNPKEAARYIVEGGVVPDSVLTKFEKLTYIPLSESGTYDSLFMHLVAQTIVTAYFNPEQCVLLRLPAVSDDITDLARQVIVTLEAILATGIVMPRGAAQNVFLVRSDLPESFVDIYDQVSFIVDDTFEFWRYTRAFHRRLRSLQYLLGGDPRTWPGVVRGLSTILGRAPSARGRASSVAPILLNWNHGKSIRRARDDR